MTDVIIEMILDCRKCGRKANRGRDIKCAECGFNKTEDTPYYMPEGYETASGSKDPEVLKLAESDVNYVCDYCKYESRAGDFDVCPQCGAPRIDVPDTEQVAVFNPSTSSPTRETPETRLDRERRKGFVEMDNFARRRIVWFTLGIVLVIFVILAGVWLFAAKETEATVIGTAWSRSLSLERRSVRSGNDWRSQMKAGAYNTACYPRKKGEEKCNPYKCNPHTVYDKCNCRKTNCRNVNCEQKKVQYNCRDANCRNVDCVPQKNGTAKCDQKCDRGCDERVEEKCDQACDEVCDKCPRTEYDTCYKMCDVIEDYCSYTYDEWNVIDQKETSGIDHEIFWPDLVANGSDERISGRREGYIVVFRSVEGKEYTMRVSESEYHRFRFEQHWKVKVTRAGGLTPVAQQSANITSAGDVTPAVEQ